MTVLAAQEGWQKHGNEWYYMGRDGEFVEDAWKYNAAKTHQFYLDDDGVMVTSDFVEYKDNLYYVNGDGVMSKNRWRLLETEDDEEARWFYFGSNGKAYKDGWKTIDGKVYHFTDYRMDYGFLDGDGKMIDEDTEDAWQDAVYFMGSNEEGWRTEESWLYIEDFEDSQYDEMEGIWLWFGSNGKKEVSDTESINGYRYIFDANGAMISDWYGSQTPSDAEYKYYRESGGLVSGRWFLAVPSEEQDAEDFDNGTERWFYAKKNGETYKNTIRNIDGEKYIFDENGIMRTGLIVVDENNHIVEILSDLTYDDYPTSDEIKAAKASGTLMYFKEDGDLATNEKVTLELDDGTFTFKFSKAGKALHGVSDNYLYDNGILITADRDETGYKYEVVTVDSKEYLVNTSGKVMKAGEYKDDDLKWTVTGNATDGFTIVTSDR